jgi:hypothetical protein
MYCPHCSKPIDVVNEKDKKTGYWSNYWFCKPCDKKVDPVKSIAEIVSDYREMAIELEKSFWGASPADKALKDAEILGQGKYLSILPKGIKIDGD